MASKAHHDSDPGEIKDEMTQEHGKIVFYPRGLNIVWGADTRYWRLPAKNDRERPAELIQVSWLEVTGSTKPLEPGKSYNISFDLALKSDAFGWNGCTLYFMAKVGRRGKYKWKKVSLKDQPPSFRVDLDFGTLDPQGASGEDRKLYFGLYEVWSGKWKGGLQIHKAEVTEGRGTAAGANG